MAGGSDRDEREAESLPELPLPPAPPTIGAETLAGLLGQRYRVVSRLGAGAFGEVFRAHDSVLGRDVAIKRIRLESFVEPTQLEEVKKRFLREAQVAARLRHPNIVTTHDIVATPAMSFIVMELVEGKTLQDVLHARGRLPLDEAIALIAQAGAALDHAHASQIVHRDVKPANVMIEPSGQVKVMDFGIAKLETGGNLTSTGLIMGTPNYMSPEQARGQKVDGRSDLFSLGCVLYECLTGDKPFGGESVSSILVKILTEEPAAVDYVATGLPRDVGAVLRRAIAKDPAARYATGAALVEALRSATQTTLSASAPTQPARPLPEQEAAEAPPPGTRKGRGAAAAWVAAAAVLALLGLLGAGFFWSRGALGGGQLPTRVAGEGGGLVRQEEVGRLGQLFGRTARVFVTVPAGTRLHLTLQTPLSSETARAGDAITAELTNTLHVEGVEAAGSGQRVSGRVVDATPAEAAEGRGRMTLEFDTLQAADGRLDLRARPLVLRATPSRKKDTGIIAGLATVGAAVGGLLGGKGGAAAGVVAGGAAGVGIVTTAKGREVALAARAPVTIELLEPLTVTRPVHN